MPATQPITIPTIAPEDRVDLLAPAALSVLPASPPMELGAMTAAAVEVVGDAVGEAVTVAEALCEGDELWDLEGVVEWLGRHSSNGSAQESSQTPGFSTDCVRVPTAGSVKRRLVVMGGAGDWRVKWGCRPSYQSRGSLEETESA